MMMPFLAKPRNLYLYSALASLLLSLWYIAIDPVSNNDGTLYLRVAEHYAKGEWLTGYTLYPRSFYSLLLAAVHTISGLDFDTSAYLLGILFNTLSVVLFISIIKQLGGDLRTQWFAAAVILLHPTLNDYRSFIIRDSGYITFYLLSALLLFHYLKVRDWRLLPAWAIVTAVAGLFRVEGFVFLFMVPVFLFARNVSGKITAIKLSLASAVALVGVAAALHIWRGQFSTLLAGDLQQALQGTVVGAWQQLAAEVTAHIATLRNALLNPYSAQYAVPLYIAAVLIIFVSEVVERVTILYGLLVGHAWYKKLLFAQAGLKAAWLWLIAIHAGILLVFAAIGMFLTGRFPLALSLTLLLAAPFSLNWLYAQWRARHPATFRANWAFPTVAVIILLTGISGLNAFTTKHHLKEAGAWLNTTMQTQDRLFSNNPIVAYYARTDYANISLSNEPRQTISAISGEGWRQYDYLAFYINRKHPEHEAEVRKSLPIPPQHILRSPKGGSVLIFSTRAAPHTNSAPQ